MTGNEEAGSRRRQMLATAFGQAIRHALKDLLRGYYLRLPTGQAVARALGLPPLEGDALVNALATQDLKDKAKPFTSRTPLWLYILAEAGDPSGPNGRHLGTVGSRIVADTFWTLIENSDDSILAPGTYLDFDSFTLPDLILLASDDTA